nr:hypothetical protein [Propionicimonas sp.]
MNQIQRVTAEIWKSGGKDKYGNPLPDTFATAIPGCLLAPEKSTVDLRAAVTVTTGGAVYLPPGSYIPSNGDKIIIGATRWTVTGTPNVWQLGIEVPVTRVT